MTPKEKAKELIDKFKHHTRAFNEITGWEDDLHSAKQCALITVDECLKTCIESMIYYWKEVKEEIEKL